MPTRTAVPPYLAVVDRGTYPLPPLPPLGPAGATITDPTFGSTIRRVTDAHTRPEAVGISFRSPSSPNALAWSSDNKHFWVISTDGTIVVFDVDPTTGAVTPAAHQPTTGFEPQFSYLTPGLLYVARDLTLHTIEAFDVTTGLYTPALDFNTGADLSGTYIGTITSSGVAPERLAVLFGGPQQDLHPLVRVTNPDVSLDVRPAPLSLTGLHHIELDRTGRYVNLFCTTADQQSARHAPQFIVWDTQAGTFTEVPASAFPYGHEVLGYGIGINQDPGDPWLDAVQWQRRSLDAPLSPHVVLPTVLTPKVVYIDGHATWNHATADHAAPFVHELYRYGAALDGTWRALDDEIIAVQVNAATGVEPTIWRFCHHRSTIVDFWDQPRVNTSPDGGWCLFTSNWAQTLGADPAGTSRQDVFLLQLAAATATTAPDFDHALGLVEQGNALVSQGIDELKAWKAGQR